MEYEQRRNYMLDIICKSRWNYSLKEVDSFFKDLKKAELREQHHQGAK